MSEGTCPERVSNGDWAGYRTCGKPIKRDGLCGIHAAARERVERNNEAKSKQRVVRKQIETALSAKVGLTVRGWSDGSWTIDREEVQRWWEGQQP